MDSGSSELLEQLAVSARSALLDVLWRQWRTLGAMTHVVKASADVHVLGSTPTLIDPEALLLQSLLLTSDEPRLIAVLRDWVTLNSPLLSVQRVNNLVAKFPVPLQGQLTARLTWLAAVASTQGKDARWRTLAKDWISAGDHEDALRDAATERPKRLNTASKGMRAIAAPLTAPESLLLRLRLGLGVGIKADAVAYLLTRHAEWTTVRALADALTYTPVATRRAIDDLAESRLIDVRESSPVVYRARAAGWKGLLGLKESTPRWGAWLERFTILADVIQWADDVRGRPVSAYAFGVQGRRLLERHRSTLEQADGASWGRHSVIDDWGAFVDSTIRTLISATALQR